MVWRVSASRSDGSQSGLSDLHTAPCTPSLAYGIDCDMAWQSPGQGDGTQQGAVEMEYFFTPGFMAFLEKLLAACGVDDWTVSAHVCVCAEYACVYIRV